MNGELDDILSFEDRMMLQECSSKIIKNLDRNLDRIQLDHYQVTRLISMRWFISNEICPKTN